jgi:hypothetical protein
MLACLRRGGLSRDVSQPAIRPSSRSIATSDSRRLTFTLKTGTSSKCRLLNVCCTLSLWTWKMVGWPAMSPPRPELATYGIL